MSEKKTKLKDFYDIAKLLKNEEENVVLYKALNNALIESINNKNGLTEIHREDKFSENDHSLETFLRRIVFECIKNEAGNLGVDIDDAFEKTGNFKYIGKDYSWHTHAFLNLDTTKAIFNFCKDNLFENKDKIDRYVFNCITELCQLTAKNEDENKIFPLDLVIYSVNAFGYDANFDAIKAIFPFIDMGSMLYDTQNFSKEDIYIFFKKIPLDCFDMFLMNEQFVAKLGGINNLGNLLKIEELENENDENAQALVRKLHDKSKKIDFNNAKITANTGENTGIRIVDDEAYKAKVKRAFMIHQLPKSIASAIMFLFGIGLFLAAGFAWSVPFLLGIGFLIPSIAAFTNSILCMKPTKTRTWLAKIFKNCAWIIDGALLITLGAVFCTGPLAIAFITLGSLGILMGCFNAFVGTLNSMWDTQRELVPCEDAEDDAASIDDIKSEILSYKIFNVVVFAIACAAGVFLALNPAILPIALPFLPAVGIGIAALSGLGLIKSALRLFYDFNSWQVGCYHVAKYIKASMFVLGGLALIALPFLPIAATLASVIGMPTLVINTFSFLVGLFSAIKGCMSFTRMSSNVKFILPYKAMEMAYGNELPQEPIDIENWKNNLWDHSPSKQKLKPSDISVETVNNLFENQN